MKLWGPLLAYGRAAAVSAFLLVLPAVGRAIEIAVEPPMPTAGDGVQIVVYGVRYPSSGPTSFAPCMNVSCWAIEGGAFGMAVCDYPGGLTTLRKGDGPTDAATYGEIGHSDLGALTAGHYVLQSTIYDATSPNPRTQTISFDVADAGRVSDGAPYGLEPVGRNPARGTFSVAAILSGDAPATVTVYDVRGRLVTSVKLDGIGLRRQPVRFGADHPFPAGVYFVRLAQGRRLAQLKQVVLQ